MRNRKYSTVIIGGEDYWEHFKFPFVVQKALDESLDFSVIELHHMRDKTPFKPFTPVTMGEGTTAMSFIVAQDDVEETFGTGLYKHTVTLMEQTKETERIMCGAKSFTNPLVKDYTDGQTIVAGYLVNYDRISSEDYDYTISNEVEPFRTAKFFSSPVATKSINIYKDDFDVYDNEIASVYVEVIYSGGMSPIRIENDSITKLPSVISFKRADIVHSATYASGLGDVLGTYQAEEHGVYGFIYQITFQDGTRRTLYFEIASVAESVSKDTYTVEDVVNILLDTSETIRVGLDTPRYRLRYKSEDQRKKFQQAAPEFRFSNGRSLWECLREVGQYVHAIPRAVHDLTDGLDYIQFDELGGTEYADMSKGDIYGGGTSINIGDYTAGLESMAANLMNLDDEAEGSLIEPFSGGFMSLRAATEEVRITEGTGLIKTTHPIAKLLRVEVGQFTVSGKTFSGCDITPYVFTKPEYDILSSFRGAYPSSKTYALYYTPDSPNVSGLWYKAQDSASEVFNAKEDYSITNVITAATGAPSGLLKGLDYPNLIFRVTYIPAMTARVRQYKPTYDGEFSSLLAYNQAANKLSARAFGENLRGQLAMLGTTSDSVMYIFQKLEDIPDPGTLYDDENYISSITARVYHDFVLAQINLSKGYNELGRRVEINNAIRQFEIPAAEDRYTVLEEFVEIGKKSSDDGGLAMSVELRNEVLRAFGAQTSGADVSLALVKTYDEDGNDITPSAIALPVISLSIGNSLYFGWRFENNFSAGSKSETGASGYRIQDYVKYGDEFYSHAHYVGVKLIKGGQGSSDPLITAHALPESTGISGGTIVMDTGNHHILWHKDSADAGCLSYQVHYITNDGLIIGDGIAYHCAAVRSSHTASQARIYFYDSRINQITGTTDTENCVASFPITVDETYRRIQYDGSPTSFKSWAIIKDGRFMLGKNSTTPPNDIYFNFKRRFKT